MAKSDGSAPKVDVKQFLASLPQLPAVFDAKEFCNRPFTLTAIDWQIFTPNEKNNYNNTSKVKMTGIVLATGKTVILESTQKGIVEPIAAIEANAYYPCDIMIVQEGKYCSIVAV